MVVAAVGFRWPLAVAHADRLVKTSSFVALNHAIDPTPPPCIFIAVGKVVQSILVGWPPYDDRISPLLSAGCCDQFQDVDDTPDAVHGLRRSDC